MLKHLKRRLEKLGLSKGKVTAIVSFFDLAINFVVILSIALLVETFLFRPFIVYGSSMCNTLNFINEKCEDTYGEFLIINKSSYLKIFDFEVGEPQRGDIVVFKAPRFKNTADAPFIKRVIGLPGEKVELKDGYVYIYNDEHPEGVKLEETYLNEANYGHTEPMDRNQTSIFEIPSEKYFVLGDNRTKSSDSRLCFQKTFEDEPCGSAENINPYIGVEDIEGKAATSFWPQPRLLQTAEYPEL